MLGRPRQLRGRAFDENSSSSWRILPTCSSGVEVGEILRSRIEGGGKGKLLGLLVAQVTEPDDSSESGGGDMGN